MGRGYWLPPGHDHLAASDGFYVENELVYGNDITAGWEDMLTKVCIKMMRQDRSFQQVCQWQRCSMCQSRLVVLKNRHVEIIADDADDYVAVWVIIPEDNAAPGFARRSFPRYLAMLKEILTELYPGAVFKRRNSQHLQKVG